MNKEGLVRREIEAFKRPTVFQEPPRATRRYTDADFELTQAQRLAKVRRELAVLPVVVMPVEQVASEPPEPKSIGDLLCMLVGALLYKTGELMESMGEKK